MTFEETINKIKSLKIQGAENIAKAAVTAIGEKLKITHDRVKLEKYAQLLYKTRPTEPALRNALKYWLENYKKIPDITTHVLKHFKQSKQKINEFGARKITNGMTIFTHCHSSTVTGIFIEAHKQGKKIRVFNTETRPMYQGRITSQELAKAGIETHHFIDSAGPMALKKCDLFLFGCDAITAEGRIINKIGTYMLVEFAYTYNIPTYTCTNSWKFDPETVFGNEEKIENRDSNEVWKNAPQDVVIHNPAFEITLADKITGIISELGVMKTEALMMTIKETYPWMI